MEERAALFGYLARQLPGFDRPEEIQVCKFSGGQSNPTFGLSTPAGRYVLRKKPAGNLVPSAHAIEREYAVMGALAGHVPVPRTRLLCEDEGIIGKPFYVMDHVDGHILPDARMLELPLDQRRGFCLELVTVLAQLHRVDYRAVGLDGFGRSGGYVERQLKRLSQQYAAARVEDNADMDLAIRWLGENLPRADESTVVHGDYRSYNVLYTLGTPRIAAVLDWELATIGHPLADLAFLCLPYHMGASDLRGFRGYAPASIGIPSQSEVIEHYCRETGRGDLPDWRFFLVFALFRSAAIRAGVFKRAFDGTATGADAHEAGRRYRDSAAAAVRLIEGATVA